MKYLIKCRPKKTLVSQKKRQRWILQICFKVKIIGSWCLRYSISQCNTILMTYLQIRKFWWNMCKNIGISEKIKKFSTFWAQIQKVERSLWKKLISCRKTQVQTLNLFVLFLVCYNVKWRILVIPKSFTTYQSVGYG